MTRIQLGAVGATTMVALSMMSSGADAHGYIKCPRARNVVAAQCGLYWVCTTMCVCVCVCVT